MSTDQSPTAVPPVADAPNGMDRRRFLTVLGVTGAGTAVLSGCSTDRVEKLVPYLVQTEDQVPGIATTYASTCTECNAGCGLHVVTRESRAIKLEGNPAHPVNRGTLCARGQAALQGLYNPDRIPGPMARNAAGGFDPIGWDEALTRLAQQLGGASGRVAVVSGAGAGTFSDLLAEWTTALGGAVVRYEPFDHEPMRVANRQLFGLDELPTHDFARARYILSFGAEFLENWMAPVEQQRGFAASHGNAADMAKHVYISPRMSLTGMNADAWYPVRPGGEAALALAMTKVILDERSGAPADAYGLRSALERYTPEFAAGETGLTPDAIVGLAREFASARPSLAVAGGVGSQHRGAIEVCTAVNLLNYVAGNIGETVRFGARLPHGDGYGAMQDLVGRMRGGQVGVLLVHESNPVYTMPAASGFRDALGQVPFKVSTSLYLDETAAACDLLLPNHHSLERWDDLRPRAGIQGLMQPVMQPVFNSRPTGDVLLQVAKQVGGGLAGFTAPDFQTHLRTVWAGIARSHGATDADAFWRESLQHGGVLGDAGVPTSVRLVDTGGVGYTAPPFDGDTAFTLVAYPSPMLHDGRGANRPWLLENPDPVTKVTWQSWVEIHPETAQDLNVREGEIVRIRSPHGTVEAPAYLYPGIRHDVVALPLGWGHTAYGRHAEGRGANPLDLLGGGDPIGFLAYGSVRVEVERTRGYHKLPKTEGTPRQLGRHIAMAMPAAAAARGLTLDEAAHEAGEAEHEVNTEGELEALAGWRQAQLEATQLGAYAADNPKWGMTIDLAKCTGCSACVTACYAENNIPTVGEAAVLRGRELSWMRIERYFEGGEDPTEPLEARFVPMLCQHCDNAPCEPVCPVYASYHTADGLNGQVYNRCVGTRYCGNNCPYKVRYFNWSAYSKQAFVAPLHLQLNPDVTVRARGVMEKCTFCIQRIRGAQHRARLEDRPLADGDVVTACAQACPSSAIVFGNAKDPGSRVVASARDPRAYHVLEEINVRPSVTYLAKVLHRSEA